jgi:hypothetical protein
VDAASLSLLAAVGTPPLHKGSYLNAPTANVPVVELGADAARLMGIDQIPPGGSESGSATLASGSM